MHLFNRIERAVDLGNCGLAYVDRVDVSVVIAVHVAIGKKAVGEQREKDKLGKCEELVARKCEAGATAKVSYVQQGINERTNRSSSVMFSSEPVEVVSLYATFAAKSRHTNLQARC